MIFTNRFFWNFKIILIKMKLYFSHTKKSKNTIKSILFVEKNGVNAMYAVEFFKGLETKYIPVGSSWNEETNNKTVCEKCLSKILLNGGVFKTFTFYNNEIFFNFVSAIIDGNYQNIFNLFLLSKTSHLGKMKSKRFIYACKLIKQIEKEFSIQNLSFEFLKFNLYKIERSSYIKNEDVLNLDKEFKNELFKHLSFENKHI